LKDVFVSKERSTDDPRTKTDRGSHSQTDKPWKRKPEKEPRTDSSKVDLDKWHEFDTH